MHLAGPHKPHQSFNNVTLHSKCPPLSCCAPLMMKIYLQALGYQCVACDILPLGILGVRIRGRCWQCGPFFNRL